MIDLRARPFYLDDTAITWVSDTLKSLSEEEKIGQLFCLTAYDAAEESVDRMLSVIKPGGVMFRPMEAGEAVELANLLHRKSDIPMLIAANLEKGGNGIAREGTFIGSPTAVAATDDPRFAEYLGTVCGREGAAVGANWAFAPIIDIDYNYHNPITNTRTFGSDPERVARMGEAYVRAVQAQGVAASIKHFPGDGVDERDQHLLSSVNSLSCEEWDATYGMVWRRCIEAGALTAMIGHIMQPAWTRRLHPGIRDCDILPASLSVEMMQGLLRGRLGFNGLIVTDASSMAGMTIPLPRRQAVPLSIAAGADMFLFTRNLEEDVDAMREGVKNGVITPERLNEAVTRILALKAALGLHKGYKPVSEAAAKTVLGCDAHKKWAQECAERAVTLVKNLENLLPLDPKKTPRVLYYPIETTGVVIYDAAKDVCSRFRDLLIAEGFQVTTFEPGAGFEGRTVNMTEYAAQFDVAIYCLYLVTKSNQTTVRIEWQQPMGANCPVYAAMLPTLAVSVENPYHLLDMPRVKTFVNAYCASDTMLKAVIDKLMGRSEFLGVSPSDPFCGKWDTKL